MADIKKKPVITVKKKDGSYVHVPLDQFKPENITRASSGDFSSPLQESLPSNQSNNNPLTSENRVSQVNAILKQISFPIPQQFENRLRSIVQLYLKDIKGKNETEEVLVRKVEEVNKNDGITDNMKQYQKKYRETNEDYFKNYRNTHKAYFKAYREKRKNSINEARREQYKTNQRDAIVKKLNDGSYKKIPYKKIEKYNIGYNDKIKLYY
jgi:hypothetical protein